MTSALTAPPEPSVRPVAWHRLVWVAWRRHRAALVASVSLLCLVALYVLVRGHEMRSAYAAVQACVPRSAASCRFAAVEFHGTYGDMGFGGGILVFIPLVMGAFAGAPLLARELETGTFRFTWTQGAGRMRWLVAMLVPGLVGVAVVTACFGALISWYVGPLLDSDVLQRLHTSLFPITGIAVVGWGLLAYAMGVLAGLLIRRVVPAITATLGVWTGLAFLASDLRQHYEAPLATSSLGLAAHSLPVDQWWTLHGVRVSATQINQVLQAIGVQTGDGGGDFQVGPGGSNVDPVQYLIQHGYTQWTSFQPDSRFWTFQGIEFAWLLALSLLLLAASVLLVRRGTG